MAGRPTDYKPEYVRIAKSMCALGALDADLAEAFDVTERTIWRWQGRHRAFADACKVGKQGPDDRVERSLYHRATGYTYRTVKVFAYRGESFEHEVEEHVPPDPVAAKFWLMNRRSKDWRDRQENKVEVEGSAAFLALLQQMSGGR